MVCFQPARSQLWSRPYLKKAGLDPDRATNYRPVSNPTYVSKLIECLVSSQLTAHLQTNHLLPSKQSAYCQHHSTETATLTIASDIFDAVDVGHVTVLALLNISAAFNTVNYGMLLRQLIWCVWCGIVLDSVIPHRAFIYRQFCWRAVKTLSVDMCCILGTCPMPVII